MSDSRAEETRLVAACIRGDATAQQELFRNYASPLRDRVQNWLRDMELDPDLVEEGLEELWVRLVRTGWRLLSHFDPGRGDLAGYLTLLGVASVQTVWRKQARRRAREVPLEGPEPRDLDEPAESEELYAREFLDGLPPVLQEHFRRVYLDRTEGPIGPSSAVERKRTERLLKRWKEFMGE